MPGKTRDKRSTDIEGAEIAAWLKKHPNYFIDYPDSLPALELPVDSGPAISLHQYQVRVLREEKAQLTQKLGVLVKNVKTNHKIHSDLLGLAANMISMAKVGRETDAFLALIQQHFALFEVRLLDKIDQPDLYKQLDTLLGKRDSMCDNNIDQALLKALFKARAPEVQSIALVPVSVGGHVCAQLILAADDEERFRPGMGGEFLKLLAQLLSSLFDEARATEK